MPLRLGNLSCGGGAASGAFCRDTRVSPSPYLSMALLQSPRHERQERRDQERKERKGKGSAAQFVANKGYLSPFPPFQCKKCRKAGQLFARSVLFPEGRGEEGPRPVNPVWD